MVAAERGMTAVCDYLLSRGAQVIALDDRGTVRRYNTEYTSIIQHRKFFPWLKLCKMYSNRLTFGRIIIKSKLQCFTQCCPRGKSLSSRIIKHQIITVPVFVFVLRLQVLVLVLKPQVLVFVLVLGLKSLSLSSNLKSLSLSLP